MRLAPLAFAALLVSSAVEAATPSFHVIDRIAGPDGGWDYVSVEAGRALIARNAAVTAIDLKSRAVTPAFAPATKGHAALVVNGGKEVLITNGGTDTVAFVDAVSGAPIAAVATGKKPDAATFDPRSGLVLVMDHAGGDVTLIDPKAHKAVGAIPIGGALEAAAVDGEGRAFVNVENKNEIVALDIAARKTIAHYALADCDGPTGIVHAQERLVAACDGSVVVVDAKTGRQLQTVRTGGGADGLAYDPAGKRVFVPAGETGRLAVFGFAGGVLALEETVPTEVGARTIAFDPVSGHVLLPSAEVTTRDGKRAIAPGTFHLLVVGR